MTVKNFRYVLLFLLYTAAESSSPCVFNITKGGENYVFDLSRLNQEKVTLDKNETVEVIMHISLCEPLKIVPSICKFGSAVCIVKKNLTGVHSHIQNVGSHYSQKMIVDSDLYLELESDVLCRNYMNYSTVIRFKCSQQETSVKIKGHKCKYSIFWTSPHVCQISNPEGLDSCVFKDKMDFIDFRQLRHQSFYEVTDNSTYEINICGPVIGGHCNGSVTGCKISKVDNSTATKIIGSYNNSLIEKHGNYFKIIYPVGIHQNDSSNEMEIRLICNLDSYSIQPKLNTGRKNIMKNYYVFQINTPLACSREKNKKCYIISEDGDKYDASLVHSSEENVKIPGPMNTTFLLNVCGSLVPDSLWPGGDDASAAVVYKDGTILNIGRDLELSFHKSNKTLFAVLRGGDKCKDVDQRLITKIKMSCGEEESQPVFLEYKNCVYIFEWKHTGVCPVKYAESVGCNLTDPIYGREIVLNPSDDEKVSYEIKSRRNDFPFSFKINLCSEIESKCNGSNDTSICLKKNNEEIVIGRRSSQILKYVSGGLLFTMTGDECKEGVISKVKVEIFCDYSAPNNSEPEFSSKDENCTFYFKWFTNKACPPRSITECSTRDETGNFFDLTPLRLHRRNYKIEEGNTTFLLNVCGSLWHGQNETCPSTSGACRIENDEMHSMGNVKMPPHFDSKGQLIVHYEEGTICRTTGNVIHENTKIVFICDNKDLEPEYVGFDQCQHLFNWKTTLACTKKDSKREDVQDVGSRKLRNEHDPCRTYHPVTKFPFDLHRLKGTTYQATGEDNSKYRISVCESLREMDRCPNRTGVCGILDDKKRKVSYGSANDRLFYDNKHLYLNYTDGDSCGDGEKKHFTVIEFSCCFKNCPPGPVSVAVGSKCEHFVRWPTKLACEMPECAVNGSNPFHTYDLSVLRRLKSNYKINMTNTPVFINICKTLTPVQGLNCPLESSSCVANGTKTYSFGNSHTEPMMGNNKTVVLKYDHGSQCELDKYYNASSAYTFKCNPLAGVGIPVYEGITEDCQYNFNWETSVVCPDTALLRFDRSSCNIVNEETGKILDLAPSFRKGAVTAKSEGKIYLVNLCLTAPTDKCNTALCSVEGSSYASYGDVHHLNFSYNFNTTTLSLSEGAHCDIDVDSTSHFYSTEIRLICTDEMEDAENTGWTAQENKCKVKIELRSPAACFTYKKASSAADGHKLRAILMGVISGLLIFLLGAILVCRFAGNRISKSDWLAISFSRSRSQSDGNSEVVYTRVGATEEATLRLGGKTPDQLNETDSDEELLRIV